MSVSNSCSKNEFNLSGARSPGAGQRYKLWDPSQDLGKLAVAAGEFSMPLNSSIDGPPCTLPNTNSLVETAAIGYGRTDATGALKNERLTGLRTSPASPPQHGKRFL